MRAALGLKDVRLHDLRHTNATRLEQSQKVSLAQLARWLGHSNIKTTYRYVNQDDSMLDDAAGALDEINEKTTRQDSPPALTNSSDEVSDYAH
jgi:integrase